MGQTRRWSVSNRSHTCYLCFRGTFWLDLFSVEPVLTRFNILHIDHFSVGPLGISCISGESFGGSSRITWRNLFPLKVCYANIQHQIMNDSRQQFGWVSLWTLVSHRRTQAWRSLSVSCRGGAIMQPVVSRRFSLRLMSTSRIGKPGPN